MRESDYGAELARVHHEHFGHVARAAAEELLARLAGAGLPAGGLVAELAVGSGILARRVLDAGFRAWGVDLSEEMLRLARAEAAGAELVHGSLWSVPLPEGCAAVTAVGEAFCYAADPAAGLSALEARLADVHRALLPGGVLLFDIAGPGRAGPTGERSVFWTFDDLALGTQVREDAGGRELTRAITLFVPSGPGALRRVEETHRLRLYTPEDVEAALARAGFASERLARYADFELPAGWHAFAATRT